MLQTGYDAVRETADARLTHAGWAVQDHGDMDPGAARGVAVRLVPAGDEGGDTSDYVLFVDGRAVGAVAHVDDPGPAEAEHVPGAMASSPLPFLYRESTGGTLFSSRFESGSPARSVSAFHRPETLASWLGTDGAPALDAPYADPLLAPDRWPGVRTGYRFTAEPSTTLKVELEFRADLLAAWEQTPGAAAASARLPWRLIGAQLHDANTQVVLATTVLPGNVGVLGDDVGMRRLLADFADAVTASLRELEQAGPDAAAEPVRCTLSAVVSPADLMGHTSDLFRVATSLTLSRPADLADAVASADDAAVTHAAATIPPQRNEPDTRRAGDHTPSAALRDFATGFEAAFRGFDGAAGAVKLATPFEALVGGADGAGATDTPLWALRWSPVAGTYASFDEPASSFFALAPLTRRPLVFTAAVKTFDAQLNTSTRTMSFTNVDPSPLAAAFLARMDALLQAAAAMLEPLAPDACQSLMASRAELATAIAAGLVPVFLEPASAGDASGAAARVEHMALASLSAAANLSAVVQAPVTVSVAGTEGAIRRFVGSVGPHAGAADPVPTCTPGPATLEGEAGAPQWLSFPLCDPAPGEHTSLELTPVFRIRLVECESPDDASAESQWLRFLRPAPALNRPLQPVDVPVPVRDMAASPVPARQATARAAVGDGDEGPLERALDWDYEAELMLAGLAAQDDLWLNLEWNAPIAAPADDDDAPIAAAPHGDAASSTVDGSGLLPLLEALVSFEESWQVLGPLVDSLRSPAGLPAEAPSAATVVGALADRVGAVASAWLAYRPEPLESDAGAADSPQGDTFVMRFQDWPRQAVRVFATAPGMDGIVWPTLNGAEWSEPPAAPAPGEAVPGPGEWLAATYPFPAAASPALVLAFQGLDATRRQTVRARCHRRRNVRLSRDPSMATNPALLQRTADASFGETAVAAAGADTLGPFQSSGTLSEALDPVLSQLAVACAVGPEPRALEAAMRYRFTVGDGLPVDLPILVSRLDGAEAAGAAAALAGAANAWFAAQAPSLEGATLVLDYTVGPEIDGESIPLIRLPEVLYTVPPGWWAPEAAAD